MRGKNKKPAATISIYVRGKCLGSVDNKLIYEKGRRIRIKKYNIVCCTSYKNYTMIRMKKTACHHSLGSLKKHEKLINSDCIYRADNAQLVNLHRINVIDWSRKSRASLSLENNIKMDLHYKKALLLVKVMESHFENQVFTLKREDSVEA
jgi:hypothetical protein